MSDILQTWLTCCMQCQWAAWNEKGKIGLGQWHGEESDSGEWIVRANKDICGILVKNLCLKLKPRREKQMKVQKSLKHRKSRRDRETLPLKSLYLELLSLKLWQKVLVPKKQQPANNRNPSLQMDPRKLRVLLRRKAWKRRRHRQLRQRQERATRNQTVIRMKRLMKRMRKGLPSTHGEIAEAVQISSTAGLSFSFHYWCSRSHLCPCIVSSTSMALQRWYPSAKRQDLVCQWCAILYKRISCWPRFPVTAAEEWGLYQADTSICPLRDILWDILRLLIGQHGNKNPFFRGSRQKLSAKMQTFCNGPTKHFCVCRFSESEKEALKTAAEEYAGELGRDDRDLTWLFKRGKGVVKGAEKAWPVITERALPNRTIRAVYNQAFRLLQPQGQRVRRHFTHLIHTVIPQKADCSLFHEKCVSYVEASPCWDEFR